MTLTRADGVIPHNRIAVGAEERDAVNAVLASGWLAAGGGRGASFGRTFARLTGQRDGVALGSGTVAVEIALRAVGATGGGVAVPAYICLSEQRAIRRAGCTPVLVDSDPDDLSFRHGALAEVADHCRAAIVAHQLGLPAGATGEIAASPIPVVEDVSTAVGGTFRGLPLGSFGRIAVCSLAATKLICAGEGGALAAGDDDVATSRRWAHPESDLDDELPVPNARLAEIPSALADVQASKLPDAIARRSAIAAHYDTVAESRGIEALKPASGTVGTYYRYLVRVPERADAVIDAARANGVTFIRPVEPRAWYGTGLFPEAEKLVRSIVSVPVFPSLTDTEVERVAGVLGAALSTAAA